MLAGWQKRFLEPPMRIPKRGRRFLESKTESETTECFLTGENNFWNRLCESQDAAADSWN